MMAERIRAWVKPLKNGTWQYYAKVPGHEREMGAAYSKESAHDAVCDYVYSRAQTDDWDIEWKSA